MRLKQVRPSGLDILLGLLLATALFVVVYRICHHLSYPWNWGAVPQFLFRYDGEQGQWVANYLVLGLLTTLRLSFWSSILALCFGLMMALARISRCLYLRLISVTYIELMRNLPPLVIIFLFYFFLADQILPLLHLDQFVQTDSAVGRRILGVLFAPPEQIPAFCSAVVTLAVFESAYVAEIFRAGIESVDHRQWEAGFALGLTPFQILKHVVFPQAFRRVLPPLAGQMISLVKDSAIVSVISIQELTYQGTQLMASTYMTIEVWVTIAALYFLLTFPCSLFVERLEKRYQRK